MIVSKNQAGELCLIFFFEILNGNLNKYLKNTEIYVSKNFYSNKKVSITKGLEEKSGIKKTICTNKIIVFNIY